MHMIRQPRSDDASDLAGLLAQLGYPAMPSDIPLRLQNLAADPNAMAWVAESVGRVVGVATAHVIHAVHKPEVVAMLTALVVDESARGTGIGTALVRTVERWAKARGASAISLTSALRRTEAHEFYRRLGYEQTGVRLAKPLP